MDTCAVAGAGGYVGRRLVTTLVGDGARVVALGRRADLLPPGAERRAVDVGDRAAVADALAGVATAYYLVHSMAGGRDFAERDRALAESFAGGAADAGVGRVVYLGGLGHDVRSEHLRSRQEVGAALAGSGVPVVELRAAVVIGAGSISFEMLRYLTERLPVMVCPRWITTRVQPVAEGDLLRYLVQAARVPPGVYEIGGPEATTYRDMIATYAEVRGLRSRLILDVPVLTPWLSAWWVDLVTPVDRRVSHALIESLVTETVVTDPEPAARAFDVEPLGVAEAIEAALREQADRVPAALLDVGAGLRDGVYAMRSHAAIGTDDVDGARDDLATCGHDLEWYGLARA
ncbi:MAG TPA: NAD(P)H-binding protein, partial [Acidimicrobiales bacterium]|nr:NAD(P)H-binding protein [Acidimicrobiales bacterium]